jgi:transposase
MADRATILRLLATHRIRDVAAMCQVSARRVYQVRGTGRPKPRISPDRRAEISRRRGKGQSVRRIASEMGVSRGIVLSCKPLIVPRGWTADDVEYVMTRIKNHNAGTICREIGRPRSSVDSLIRRLREQ